MARVKNILFWFFVGEHLLLLLLILVSVFFYVKTYAFSPFGELDRQAREFVPTENAQNFKKINTRFQEAILNLKKNPDQEAAVSFSLSNDEINNFLSKVKLPNITKEYLKLASDNEFYAWALITDLGQPLMVRSKISYDKETGFDLEFKDLQLGPLPLPLAWTNFLDLKGVIGRSLSEFAKSFKTNQDLELENFTVKDQEVDLTIQIGPNFDPEKLH